MSEGNLINRFSSLFRRSVIAVPNESPRAKTEIKELRPGTIRGEVIIGKTDPRTLSKDQFEASSELLYHGAAKEFTYSSTGEYDLSNTGGDGTTDYGFGFYTTNDRAQAENYSLVRSSYGLEKPVVYSFLPHNAKMLDVRDINNSDDNGILPDRLVDDWLDYLTAYYADKNNFSGLGDFGKRAIKDGIKSDFIERLSSDLEEGKRTKIRTGGRKETFTGIFWHSMNGLIDIAFQKFMREKGYDGMIYMEGGEGEKRESLTGYIFYNPKAVDTWEGWQSRK